MVSRKAGIDNNKVMYTVEEDKDIQKGDCKVNDTLETFEEMGLDVIVAQKKIHCRPGQREPGDRREFPDLLQLWA